MSARDRLRIGTSGWHYTDWRGVFYPPEVKPADFLAYYQRHFDTVEINNSFYKLPSEDTMLAWREAVPPGFCYALKGSRFLTHMKKLKEPEHALTHLLARAELLGDRLGPVLFQLPPRWRYNGERLNAFLAALPKTHRYVLEFREPGWYNPEAYAILRAHGAALCIHDMGGHVTPAVLSAEFAYVRFHGAHGNYTGAYGSELLRPWASRLAGWASEGLEVFAYFNNDVGGHAPHDAKCLIALVREALGEPLRQR